MQFLCYAEHLHDLKQGGARMKRHTSSHRSSHSGNSIQPVPGTQGYLDFVHVNTPEELLSVCLDHPVNAPVSVLEALGLDTVDPEEDEMTHAA